MHLSIKYKFQSAKGVCKIQAPFRYFKEKLHKKNNLKFAKIPGTHKRKNREKEISI